MHGCGRYPATPVHRGWADDSAMTIDTLSSERPRLLIADDDAFVRSALCLQLGRSFTIVGGACDADQAIEQADALRPDIMIVDIEMPAGGGLRATHVIHDRCPTTAIVALSSDESESLVRAILLAGAVTYVRKGIEPHELQRTLHSAMTAHTFLQATDSVLAANGR
jgi:DNA-binding NarL/FixJ family response regulator